MVGWLYQPLRWHREIWRIKVVSTCWWVFQGILFWFFFRTNFKAWIFCLMCIFCLIQVSMDKWMDVTEMGYIIASRYNVILVSLSWQQSMIFFPLRSQPPTDSSVHRIICVGHVFWKSFCPGTLNIGNLIFKFMHSFRFIWVNNVCSRTTSLFERPLSFTASSIVVVNQLLFSGKAVANSIY